MRKFSHNTHEKYAELSDFLNTPNPTEDREALDTRTGFLRELSRWIAVSDPDWSAYYENIRAAQRKIHLILIMEIDENYRLGDYLYEERAEQYRQQHNMK